MDSKPVEICSLPPRTRIKFLSDHWPFGDAVEDYRKCTWIIEPEEEEEPGNPSKLIRVRHDPYCTHRVHLNRDTFVSNSSNLVVEVGFSVVLRDRLE